jgi:MoxR-like ATPases
MARQKQIRDCKRCGMSGLVWNDFGSANGKTSWRLMHPATGAVHDSEECRSYGQSQGRNMAAWNAPAQPSTSAPQHISPAAPEPSTAAPVAVHVPVSADDSSAGAVLWRLIGPHADAALGQAIADKLQASLAQIDQASITEQVCEAAMEKLRQAANITVHVTAQDVTKTVVLENAHYQTADLIRLLSDPDTNVMIVGPSQAGKTHACGDAARGLGLDFYSISVGPQTSKTDLFGYMDAHGHYQTTSFRQAFEHGGVFLLDEMDAGNPGILTMLNAATANGHCSFPDNPKGVQKHADFRCVAAANTWGNGASRQYVGRNQMDAATLKRFVKVAWNYDEALERKLCAVPDWCEYVQSLRKAQAATGCRVIFSMRDVTTGGRMLTQGWSRADVEQMVLWADVSADDKAKLLEALGGL